MSLKAKKITTIIVCLVVIVGSGVFITSRVLGVTIGGTLIMGGNIDMANSYKVIKLATPSADSDAATFLSVKQNTHWARSSSNIYPYNYTTGLFDSSYNVGIGIANPGTNKLEVVGGPIKATGGLIMETRTTDPASPATGQIWICTDAPGANATNYDCI